jgi:hypothetical protein
VWLVAFIMAMGAAVGGSMELIGLLAQFRADADLVLDPKNIERSFGPTPLSG